MTNPGTDGKVDRYIEQAEEFAQPILVHLRALVHKACPTAGEAMKWSMPFFTVGGKNLCNMAAFQKHAAFGFWEGLDIDIPKAGDAMGHFGRITTLADLPEDQAMLDMIKSAASQLKKSRSTKPEPVRKKPVKVPPLPDDLDAAIASDATAQKAWDDFAPSHRKEYIEWITQAKREATRRKRISQAIEWIAEGKDRNWKYR